MEAKYSEDADFEKNESDAFATKTERYERMMKLIRCATVSLQRKFLTLSEPHYILGALIGAVEEERIDPDSDLNRYLFGKKFIASDSDMVKSRLFESAIIKIQKNFLYLLSDTEKEADSHLKLDSIPPISTRTSLNQSPSARLTKNQRLLSNYNENINCHFVYG